jgi:hypothetical protein
MRSGREQCRGRPSDCKEETNPNSVDIRSGMIDTWKISSIPSHLSRVLNLTFDH